MTDDKKQKAKDEFASIVKADIDVLFDKPLSDSEMDSVIVGEMGAIIEDMTAMNNISSDLIEDTKDTLDTLKRAESDIVDLDKLLKTKQDLDMAA